jgi:hypothetical protein
MLWSVAIDNHGTPFLYKKSQKYSSHPSLLRSILPHEAMTKSRF